MNFDEPLIPARLCRRYKRFLADVVMADGTVVTAHCPNTGSMLGCVQPGARVWLSRSSNPRRKYPLTWELVEVDACTLVGINTARSNALVKEAIEAGGIAALRGYHRVRREVRLDSAASRIDFVLEAETSRRHRCYVEVKNVTAAVTNGIAMFPDAVTTRGTRHLRELAKAATQGDRAVIFFCVQRRDVEEVRPADAIDPEYGRALRRAVRHGVEPIAYRSRVTTSSIVLEAPVPVVCPNPGTGRKA